MGSFITKLYAYIALAVILVAIVLFGAGFVGHMFDGDWITVAKYAVYGGIFLCAVHTLGTAKPKKG